MIHELGKATDIYYIFKDVNDEKKVVPVKGVYVTNAPNGNETIPIPVFENYDNNG